MVYLMMADETASSSSASTLALRTNARGRRAAWALANLDNPDWRDQMKKPRASASAQVVVINYSQDRRIIRTVVTTKAESEGS